MLLISYFATIISFYNWLQSIWVSQRKLSCIHCVFLVTPMFLLCSIHLMPCMRLLSGLRNGCHCPINFSLLPVPLKSTICKSNLGRREFTSITGSSPLPREAGQKLKEERNLETDTEAETVEEQYWLAYSVTILIQARLISPVMTLPTTGWSALNQFAIRKKNPSHMCRGQSDEDDSLSASLFPDVSTWQPRLYIHHNTHFTLLSFNSLL